MTTRKNGSNPHKQNHSVINLSGEISSTEEDKESGLSRKKKRPTHQNFKFMKNEIKMQKEMKELRLMKKINMMNCSFCK